MEILRDRESLRQFVQSAKENRKTIGFAPTMGALHQGHLSLYEAARKENDTVVASIFVNPTQFNNPEDLEKYPRTEEKDIEMLEQSGNVDAVYIPQVKDLYPHGLQSQQYDFGGLENKMEGKARPGHFDGVGTVVEAFFRQIEPDNAYFGEKDFQQLAIIRKMAETRGLSVKIHGQPIYREDNGLAMSSRNQRLTENRRDEAKIIYETLLKVQDWFRIITIPEINRRVTEIFKNKPGFELEYFTIADEETLKATDFFYRDHQYRAFIVVSVDGVRLIDNIGLG